MYTEILNNKRIWTELSILEYSTKKAKWKEKILVGGIKESSCILIRYYQKGSDKKWVFSLRDTLEVHLYLISLEKGSYKFLFKIQGKDLHLIEKLSKDTIWESIRYKWSEF